MNLKKGGLRTALVVIPAVIVVVALIVLFSFRDQEEDTEQAIVLPSQSTETLPSQQSQQGSSNTFVEITKENIKTALETLQRPNCYYQSLTVERAYEGGSAMEYLEVWRRENVYKIEITPEGQTTRHYLTDGKTVYLWFDDEESATETTLPDGWTVDDLMGIPTYETIRELEDEQILEASTVELSSYGGTACIYVRYEGQGSDVQEYNWIGFDSGMLVQAHTVSNGNLTYRMVQTDLQRLTTTDTVFDERFQLPDGTVPFTPYG